MTFFRKYMALIVGGAIALVLIFVVLVLLFKFRAEYARVQSDLQTSLVTLDRLHQRDPFPTRENVERVKANLEDLEAYLDELLGALSRDQVTTEDMERAAFPAEIERTARRLRALAGEKGVDLAEGVAFGFQRYAAGNLPAQEHVPRLVVQLRTVEALCSLLFNAGISELVSVEREVFDIERTQEPELSPAVGRRPGRAPAVVAAPTVTVEPEGVEGLYTKERYKVTFFGTDPVVRDVFNTMTANPMLMIVRNLELRNELGLGGSPPAAQLTARLQPRDAARPPVGGVPGAPRDPTMTAARPLQHDDRVVAGRERVRVIMELDVYRFEDHGQEEGMP